MSSFGQCKLCNKTTSYEDIPVCKTCLDECYLKVREYLYANRSATPEIIHENTGVPIKVITYFVENGSLEEKEKSDDEKALEERRKKLEMLQKFNQAFTPSKPTVEPETPKTGGFFTDTRRR